MNKKIRKSWPPYSDRDERLTMNKDENIRPALPFGQLRLIDLNSGQCSCQAFPEAARPFIGGRGLNVWYLYHHLPAGIDALSPENILMISCGLLTGSSAPTSARLHLNALSPLTGILGSSNIGGYAGAWLRSCNLAGLVIAGKALHPVYLYVDTDGCRLLDAAHLTGRDTFDTQDLIAQAHPGKELKILAIGPAGESRVKFAAIITGKDHAAGRTGMGSVMGSKNLKAIVIAKGNHKHFPADTPLRKKAVSDYVNRIKQSSEFKFFSTFGGSGYVEWANAFGIMGSRNYSETGVSQVQQIDSKSLQKSIVRSSGCYRCPVQCKADLKLGETGKEKIFTRPEFEPMINLGPKCGLNDINQIIRLDNLCSRLGIDSTSAATVIAFAMELFEKKILPAGLAGDLDLSWGNADVMEELIYQMVEGRDLGKILGQGVKRAAEIIGNGSEKYAAHVKGLELTAYHPSTIMGTALGYAVSSRGGDYNNVYASLEYSWSEQQAENEFGTRKAVDIKSISAKGQVIKKAVITNIIVDSLGLCKVPVLSLLKSFNLENEVELINGLTGIKLTADDLFTVGLQIAALEKWFNIKHSGADVKDTIPDRFMEKSHDPGLTRQGLDVMLQEYYNAMGWDANGTPPVPPVYDI